MNSATIIDIDLAKRIFHAHAACNDCSVAFGKRLTRAQMHPPLSARPRCGVAIEACASAPGKGRAIKQHGQDVRLIPPSYVTPHVKRQKNDTADAEAIAEAGSRPIIRFVSVKTEEQRARAMIFRTRDLLVRQRTQLINALRGHLSEHGLVVSQGPADPKTLAKALDATDVAMPQLVRDLGRIYLQRIEQLNAKVVDLEKTFRREAQFGEETRRLQTMPGIGPITAMAVAAFAPMQIFKRGRDLAAWLGLVPVQHSMGGKQRLGRTSRTAQRDIRRLRIVGAGAVIRWAPRRSTRVGSWFSRMMDRKPLMLVSVAFANKMPRAIWAMQAKKEDYPDPRLPAA